MISSSHAILVLSACLAVISSVESFAPAVSHHVVSLSAAQNQNGVACTSSWQSASTALSMAGFGGAAPSKKGKKKGGGSKLPKLKAKSQWDRYADLKKFQKFAVGVRVKGEDEWMKVGRVRSKDDANTEAAVATQRALIAEHSKRLYPVQIPANAVLEWGYLEGEDEDSWKLVDKSAGDDASKGIEKEIGFEGISDKATGFYCYYHEGRVVEREEEGKGKRKIHNDGGF